MSYIQSLALMVLILVASPQATKAEETQGAPRGAKVRVLSPRSGAELAPGTDKLTIVVEVQDTTEHGIRLKKGIPIFDDPTRKDGSINQPVKDNLEVFLKNLVGVTVYSLPRRPGRPTTTIYQLTSIIKTALLSGGCQHPVYPPDVELPASGQSTVWPSRYLQGAAFQFEIGKPGPPDEKESASRICIVLPQGQGY